MSINLSKTFLVFSASLLLVAASVTSSNAKSHETQTQTQAKSSDNDDTWDDIRHADNSCFLNTGIPDMYACSGGY